MGGEGHRRGEARATSLFDVVVIAVEELVRAPLGAEVAAEGVSRAALAGPSEADRALLEELVQLTHVAGEALHGREVYTARTRALLNL
jgi:hypothetical protein